MDKEEARRARLAEALRANLKRRKAGRDAPAQPVERDGDPEGTAQQPEHDH